MSTVRRPVRGVLIALLLTSVVVETGLWLLSGPSSRAAIATSVAGTLLAAGGIWFLTGKVHLSPRPTPGFMGLVALAGLVFGNLMVGATYAAEAYTRGVTLGEAARSARFLGAEFVFWLWLFALLTAGAYGSRIRQSVGREREQRIAAQAFAAEARLETLRGQLNPHFLFNALHGVSALVRRDAAQAELALERLAELLRFSLDRVADPVVGLNDELRFTRTYVELERLALGPRLRFVGQVDDRALDAEVPPFAIQTLIENAIRHAIAPRPEGGTIALVIERTSAEAIRIRVDDDGGGRDAPGGGRGLANLRARLAAQYGGAAVLTTGQRLDGGFRAELELPLP